ncbi:hypothetical protein V6N12_047962 [Hibiscus sabdariffa]|uniref:Uncharacterized protein n=1 Tax=Hibiscus sabdariffa TaxID=183260 RepID=A0ABR2CUX7_9ROSI
MSLEKGCKASDQNPTSVFFYSNPQRREHFFPTAIAPPPKQLHLTRSLTSTKIRRLRFLHETGAAAVNHRLFAAVLRTQYTVNLEDFYSGVEHFKVKLPLDNFQTKNGGGDFGLKSDGQDAEHDSESDRGR